MAPKLNINQLPIKYYIFSEYFIMKIYISLVLIDKTYQTIWHIIVIAYFCWIVRYVCVFENEAFRENIAVGQFVANKLRWLYIG